MRRGVHGKRFWRLVFLHPFFFFFFLVRKNLVRFISLVACTVHGKKPEVQRKVDLCRETIWHWTGTFVVLTVCPPQLHSSRCEISLLPPAAVFFPWRWGRWYKRRTWGFTPHLRLIRNLTVIVLWDKVRLPRVKWPRSSELLHACCFPCALETWPPPLWRLCFPHLE